MHLYDDLWFMMIYDDLSKWWFSSNLDDLWWFSLKNMVIFQFARLLNHQRQTHHFSRSIVKQWSSNRGMELFIAYIRCSLITYIRWYPITKYVLYHTYIYIYTYIHMYIHTFWYLLHLCSSCQVFDQFLGLYVYDLDLYM